jgi:hypothetical protein
MTGAAASPRITGERWIEWTPERQLQILPLRVRMTAVCARRDDSGDVCVRMTAVMMVRPERPGRQNNVICQPLTVRLKLCPDTMCRP